MSKGLLTHDHPTFALSSEVSNFVQDFFSFHGFNYFQFARLTQSGQFNVLTNNPFPVVNWAGHGFPIAPPFLTDQELCPWHIFLLEEVFSGETLKILHEQNRVFHGITLLRRYKSHYDLVTLGMPQMRPNITSYYLSHLPQFHQFFNHFVVDGRDLIKKLSGTEIQLPEYIQPRQDDSERDKAQRYSVQGTMGLTYVTPQEATIINLLKSRLTYKEIGRQMGISDRTVEAYLKRIRSRTGCVAREDLLRLI